MKQPIEPHTGDANWTVGDGRDIWERQTAWRRLEKIFYSFKSSLVIIWLKFVKLLSLKQRCQRNILNFPLNPLSVNLNLMELNELFGSNCWSPDIEMKCWTLECARKIVRRECPLHFSWNDMKVEERAIPPESIRRRLVAATRRKLTIPSMRTAQACEAAKICDIEFHRIPAKSTVRVLKLNDPQTKLPPTSIRPDTKSISLQTQPQIRSGQWANFFCNRSASANGSQTSGPSSSNLRSWHEARDCSLPNSDFNFFFQIFLFFF